ncbi:MAG: endonuclease/exonuclease/phosphatase family protein, partial [Flavobacteriales bacterium]|nr:endonuclease/exonuclease/phosphatase family protein [Flavobacteriales bacterium]
MKKILMSVAALVMCAVAITSCEEEKQRLTVVSYNMRVGTADDGENSWEKRKRATPLMLRDKMPDIFGVQEALGFQVDYIMENCPEYASVGVGRDDGAEKGEYMSIFWNTSYVEMKDWGTFWLSETPDVPSMGWDAACMRTATWALMKDKRNGREFYYVNTHLD